MIRAMFWLGISELRCTWKQSAATIVFVALTITMTLSVIGYRRGLVQEYNEVGPAYLVVQEVGTFGELGNSRLGPTVTQELELRGAGRPIPQINRGVGTSVEDVVQIRGVSLSDYAQVTPFDLLEGQALTPDSATRQALVGWRLAERLNLKLGGLVRLRGRDFTVIGIFRTGTYTDNQAWISLTDAQALVGYGQDVSIYLVPDNGVLQVGELLPGNAEVIRRGEALRLTVAEFAPIISFFNSIMGLVSLICGLTLAVVLLRLAWVRRRVLATLQCLGYSRPWLAVYLGVQSAALATAGSLAGGAAVATLATIASLDVGGLAIPLRIDLATALAGTGWLAAIALTGASLPVVWLGGTELDGLLRAD
jgi:ABC-type lipoprotein release transport system permease subunit